MKRQKTNDVPLTLILYRRQGNLRKPDNNRMGNLKEYSISDLRWQVLKIKNRLRHN
jgi:hypothetical protein